MFLILILITLTILYYIINYNYQYWQRKGINGPKPIFLLGNLGKSVTFRVHAGEIYDDIYRKFSDEELVGIYRIVTPILLVRDPELIKEITVKSFSNFHDNDVLVDKKSDPIFGRNPFVLKGEEWKIVRTQLTPAFSSGKMKWLYPLLEDVSKNLVKFVDKTPEMTNGKGYDLKEISTRFTLNNVASCAFGLDGRCFEEDRSMFRQLAEDFLSPEGFQIFYFTLTLLFPPIAKIVSPRLSNAKVQKDLIDLVSKAVKYREENDVVRNDMLHLLVQLKKTCKDYEFTDLDIAAHAAGFFADGYETSSIVMSFTLFHLALNPEAQKKLREEVTNAFEENKGQLPYDVLQGLPYLDAVIHESLRIRPPFFFLQKHCTKPFSYTPKNSNKSVLIEEGTSVIIPTCGLHHDAKYFDDPEEYRPERFLPQNKENITKYTYMPFGEGQRTCLGQRFALLQIKTGISYLIKNFEISVNEKTQFPIKYQPTHFLSYPIGGLWANFKKVGTT